MNRKLGRCPTCKRALDDEIRAAMGLRNGEELNALCPGLIGPSDIDHVLNNDNTVPERTMFYEYSQNGAKPADGGQRRLHRSLSGRWREVDTGRLIEVRFTLLPEHPASARTLLMPGIRWLWPQHATLLDERELLSANSGWDA